MKTIDAIEIVSKISFFNGLKERQLKQIVSRLHEQTYPAGSTIIQQGAVGFGLFMIVSGAAEVQYTADDGSISVVNTLGPYDFFGEMALLDDGLRSASVIATEKTECLFLDRIEFIALMMEDAEIGVVVATELAKRIRRLLETLENQ